MTIRVPPGYMWDENGNLVLKPFKGVTIDHNPNEFADPPITPEDVTTSSSGGQLVPRGGYGPSPTTGPGGGPVQPFSNPYNNTKVLGPNGIERMPSRLPANTPSSQMLAPESLGTFAGNLPGRIFKGTPVGRVLNIAKELITSTPADTGELPYGGMPNYVRPEPQTQTEPSPLRDRPPLPPGGPPGPPNDRPPIPMQGPPMRPFFRGPVPVNPTNRNNAPTVQTRSPVGPLTAFSGGGTPADMGQADPGLGHYRATLGNARGQTWVPSGMDAPAPQIYRGPQTMWGAGGAQNYYIPGSAPMGPGDWTGTTAPQASGAAAPVGGRGGGAPSAAYPPMPPGPQRVPLSQTPMPPPRPANLGQPPNPGFGQGPFAGQPAPGQPILNLNRTRGPVQPGLGQNFQTQQEALAAAARAQQAPPALAGVRDLPWSEMGKPHNWPPLQMPLNAY